MVGPEPRVRAAVQKEQFAFLGASRPPAAMGLILTDLATVPGRPQQAAERLVGDDDAVILGQDVGQVGEVVIAVDGGCQVEDLLPQGQGELVVGRAGGVAMTDAGGTARSDLGLEALDLANGLA